MEQNLNIKIIGNVTTDIALDVIKEVIPENLQEEYIDETSEVMIGRFSVQINNDIIHVVAHAKTLTLPFYEVDFYIYDDRNEAVARYDYLVQLFN